MPLNPEACLQHTLSGLPGPPYTSDHRFLALASALTTWPSQTTSASKPVPEALAMYHPWVATLVTTLCDTQQDVDHLRAALASVALNVDLASTLSEDAVKQAMQTRLLDGPYGPQWTVAAKTKPQLKLVARSIMEAMLLRDAIGAQRLGYPTFKDWITSKNPDPGALVLAVSHMWCGSFETVACLPEVLLVGGSGASAQGWATVLYESLARGSSTYAWNKPGGLTAVSNATAKPKAKPAAVAEPAKPAVDPQVAAKKLFEDIKVMIKTEVQTAIAANSSLLESMVKTVITSTPTLLDKAMAKVIAQQTSTSQFGTQLQQAINTSLSTIDVASHVAQASKAHVAAKLDVAKIRKEVVDKVMANNDEYFAAMFDRIVVMPVPPGPQTPYIGTLAMKAPIDPKALPTLPAEPNDDL